MKRAAAPSRLLLLSFQLLGAVLALASGLLGLAAWAASPPAEDSLPVAHFARACAALEDGDLASAARHVRALREASPEAPEGRLLEALLVLRREQPALGWLDAFIRAWHDAGRPDLGESRILPPEEFTYEHPDAEPEELLADSPEAAVLLALLKEPSARHGRLVLQHLHALGLPEFIFAADDTLQSPSVPPALRAQAARAVRARLSELTVASPRSMQYPALLLVHDSSEDAPFTAEELRGLEAVAALPDWRETDFHVLYEHSLGHFKAMDHAQPTHAAFMLAVTALATRPAYLLYKKTEASREALAPEQLRRLGEALWRIGSRLAAESTLLERMLGARMMVDGAELAGDELRAARAVALRDEWRAAANATRQAVPERWLLRGLSADYLEAKLRDEMGTMLRFLPPTQ
ncbi:MAG: hypothetical protein JXB05_38245 [Myxococcaceae bacterium]|nr:hypothetical protein [Myxococcaceae bacterium]